MKIILASQSSRRKELLTQMGVSFEATPSDFDEKLDDSRSPETVAIELALGKAMAVASQHPESLVIGSDTIVTVAGKQLEKPLDAKEAYETLQLLSGTVNEVSTGVAVVCLADGLQLTGAETTEVFFKPFDKELVEVYVRSGDPLDKAGSYGIQSGAAPLIDHIEGDYDTVIGLPTALLADMLAKAGVTAKPIVIAPPVPQIRK